MLVLKSIWIIDILTFIFAEEILKSFNNNDLTVMISIYNIINKMDFKFNSYSVELQASAFGSGCLTMQVHDHRQ